MFSDLSEIMQRINRKVKVRNSSLTVCLIFLLFGFAQGPVLNVPPPSPPQVIPGGVGTDTPKAMLSRSSLVIQFVIWIAHRSEGDFGSCITEERILARVRVQNLSSRSLCTACRQFH